MESCLYLLLDHLQTSNASSVLTRLCQWARICFIRLAQGEIDGATSQKLVGSLLRNMLWQYNSIDFIAIIHDCANMKLSPAVYVRITVIYSSDLHSIWYNEESYIFSYLYSRGNIKFPCFLLLLLLLV